MGRTEMGCFHDRRNCDLGLSNLPVARSKKHAKKRAALRRLKS
jgi:hypothetical protein